MLKWYYQPQEWLGKGETKMTYLEHLNFVRIVNSAKWFKTYEMFFRAFSTYPEKLLIKAWKKAKGE